ncbi:MAG: V-type ATP synthase subunit E family protein, partial [Halobacteriota archaeon]
MGLEVVVKDVLARGEEEANRIRQDGRDEANAIIAGAEKTAHQIREERIKQTTEQIESRKNREISTANLEVKRAILTLKKSLLDRAYD